jgi:sulfotransferase family protein
MRASMIFDPRYGQSMVDEDELCRCGSGKRYRDCHGGPASAAPERIGFVIAGAQKSGTSAIFHYLHRHPQVCLHRDKELHFFDRDRFFKHGIPDYSRYRALLDPASSHTLLGDATPSYMYWEPAPRRIWHYNATMKFIIVLRNPVTRAYSHWNMFKEQGVETLPFYEALLAEPERRRRVAPRQLKVESYIDRGFYTEQLRRIAHLFPPDQVLVLRTEELRAEPQRVVDRITDFLGLDRLPGVQPEEVYSIPYKEPMSGKAREYLLRIFEYEIRQLERMLGWDCADWLEPARDHNPYLAKSA